MKKFRRDSKRYVRAGIFVLCVISISQIATAQPEHKFSIQDKIMQEKQTESVMVNALAPKSVFSTPETTETLLQQMKLLVRLKYEDGSKELRSIHEELPSDQSPHKVSSISRQLSQENQSESVKPVIKQPKNQFKREISQTQIHKISSENFHSKRPGDSSNQLITHNNLQGTINTLSYERIEGKGIRFRYPQIPEEMVGHFWWFKTRDLRGKTIRVYYSGIVPHEITFLISHSSQSAKAIYSFHLEDSPTTKIISFQIPNRPPFKDISIFELRVEKSRAEKPYGDFLIEKVEVAVGDNVSTPIEMRNQSYPFTFGGPYLQSNIWGGEVKTS